MKGVAIWALAILTGIFLAGLVVYNLVTVPPPLPHGQNVPGATPGGDVSGEISGNDNVKNPIDIGGEAAGSIPWEDIKEYFFGGLFGVLTWFSRYIVTPGIEF